MIIKCFRDGKEINTPDSSNADYVIADDTVVREPREVIIALKYNEATRAKKAMMEETTPLLDTSGLPVLSETGNPILTAKYPDLVIDEDEYDALEVSSIREAELEFLSDLIKVKGDIRFKDIQKTGIICPDCYKPTDFVIWGVHKVTQ